VAPDPDLYGPPERDNEDPQQEDDWDLFLEWAPPVTEDDDDNPT
jgi:hypothetical protein